MEPREKDTERKGPQGATGKIAARAREEATTVIVVVMTSSQPNNLAHGIK